MSDAVRQEPAHRRPHAAPLASPFLEFDLAAEVEQLHREETWPRRGHVIRCQGEPECRGTRLPGIIMAWMQRRHLEVDIDETLLTGRI